jgi:glycosyltransferase involved in cell wall biosynthesis
MSVNATYGTAGGPLRQYATPPKISIITPSYNQGPFIERTIRSILDQNYLNLEYIVMDGGSTDGTIDILKKYGERLKWISRPDEGQSDAINKGIAMATGDIIAYLNSDDVYEPGALERVAECFSAHPESMWLTGRCRIIDEDDYEVRKPITAYKNALLRCFSYRLLLVTNPISQPATFWRRGIVEEFGAFDRGEHLVMDYEYWLRIGRKYRPAIVDDYLARFRVHAASKTSSSFLTTFRREMEIAKRYSDSTALNALHYLSYRGISSIYLLLNSLGGRRGNT